MIGGASVIGRLGSASTDVYNTSRRRQWPEMVFRQREPVIAEKMRIGSVAQCRNPKGKLGQAAVW